MDIDGRIHNVELSQTKLEERLAAVQHDAKNIRQMVSGMASLQDVRHGQLEGDIKDLGKRLFSVGMSVVGSIITLLLGIVAYFLVQRDERQVLHKETMQAVERIGER